MIDPVMDGRSKRILKSMRVELSKQLGHKPSPAEAALIERLCWLQLRLQLLDRKLMDGRYTDFDASCYVAHSNGFARGLAHLGLVGKGSKGVGQDNLSEYFAKKASTA